MALPVTISSVQFVDQNYFVGPFIDGNSNVYTFLLDSTNTHEIEAHKATDPPSSFSEQDSANKPTSGSGTPKRTFWMFQNGDTVHIISDHPGLLNNVRYHTFRTSDHATNADTWGVIDEVIESVNDESASNEVSCSIVARSDGTVVVIYNGDEDSVMGNPYARVDYNIRSTVPAWGGPVTLVADEKAEVDWFGSVAVLGASDKTHFFFTSTTNAAVYHRSLTSGDSLNSLETVDSSAGAGAFHPIGPGIFFDDSGTERIRVPYYDVTSGAVSVSIAQIDADDGSPAIVSQIGDNDVQFVNSTMVTCLAVDGTTAHLLYGSNDDDDLFHDQADTPQDSGDWGTDTEFLDAVTINRISCNVIDRSGKKLAMVYDNAGTIQYNEKDIAVVGGATYLGWVSSRGWF